MTGTSGQPPGDCPTPMLWRVAWRLFVDHGDPGPAPERYCRMCGEPWPCDGRRLGERGLLAIARAVDPPQPPGQASRSPWWSRP